MRIHYFQHVPFEGLAYIETLLNKAQHQISRTAFFADEAMPQIDAIDALIIMGGPMSVNDTEQYPWLKTEMSFVKQMIDADKPVLGICLGAQIIARSLGAKVYKNPEKEIGWFMLKPASANSLMDKPFNAFHWHGETFDLPENANLLASSQACKNQIFQVGKNVIGLQCHLEITPESVKALIEHCQDELIDAPFIQNTQQLLSAPAINYQNAHACLEQLLKAWLA